MDLRDDPEIHLQIPAVWTCALQGPVILFVLQYNSGINRPH